MNAFLSDALAGLLGRKSSRLIEVSPQLLSSLSAGNCGVPEVPAERPKVNTAHHANQGSCGLGLVNERTPPELSRVEKLVMALVSVGEPICISALAKKMNCSPAEASRRIKLAGPKVKRKKRGKYVFVSLR